MEPERTTLTEAERAEYEALSSKLAKRGSVLHFAIAFVACFVCVVAAGAGFKLRLDLAKTSIWYLYAPLAALALASLAVAATGFVRFGKLRSREHADFQRMLELRGKVGLD